MSSNNTKSHNYSKNCIIITIFLVVGISIGFATFLKYITDTNITNIINILIFAIIVGIFTIVIYDAVRAEVIGYYNLKILGILLVAAFTTFIVFIDSKSSTAAIKTRMKTN